MAAVKNFLISYMIYCYVFGSVSEGGLQLQNKNPEYVNKVLRLAKSADMSNSMDTSINPCDNFYDFACGNWLKLNPANSLENIKTGMFEKINSALDRKIILLLNDKADKIPHLTDTDRLVRNFYESCLLLTNSDESYRKQLIQIIHEFGEMPALSNDSVWREEEFDWLNTIGRISHKYGISIILGVEVMADFNNNTRNILYIGHPEFALETRAMYVDNVTAVYRTAYTKSIGRKLERFLGMEKHLALSTAKEIVNFEIELAKATRDDTVITSISEICTLTTLDDMNQKYGPASLDIKRLVNITYGYVLQQPVYESFAEYQQNLVEVLQRTPKRTVANYIYFNLINEFMPASSLVLERQQQLCVGHVKKYFAKVLDNMFYRKYYNRDMEMSIKSMWSVLKQTFASILMKSNKINWIRKATRQYAIDKLNAMKLEISSYSDTNFTKEYDGLQAIVNDDYIGNLKNIIGFYAKKNRDKIHQAPQPLEAAEIFSYTPANIIMENKIRVPVSLLQPFYFWATNYPTALKFATIGTLISHEMLHGFDDVGRTFDKDGNNRNWWDNSSTQAFHERTQCFIDQYKNYKYGGRKLPEMSNQSENIADNGGIHIAYEAYQNWYENALKSSAKPNDFEMLPLLNYTGEQLFFISFAQLWCSDTHPSARNLQTSTDIHVPNMYRVIGPLSNFLPFSASFKCPLGSFMNPIKKCEIY